MTGPTAAPAFFPYPHRSLAEVDAQNNGALAQVIQASGDGRTGVHPREARTTPRKPLAADRIGKLGEVWA